MIKFYCFYGAGKEYTCNNDLVGFESQRRRLDNLQLHFISIRFARVFCLNMF